MWRQFIKDYFSYSRKERWGIFILLAIILICALAPLLYPFFIPSSKTDIKLEQVELLNVNRVDSGSAQKHYERQNYSGQPSANTKAELFYFDPNTITPQDWNRLGIGGKTPNTIRNYISKGGHFYKPEDLRKIWGLHKEDADRLIPYVRIISVAAIPPQQKQYINNYQPSTSFSKKSGSNTIDINNADSLAWVSLPGIGPSYSKRIINFRNRLGGFHNISQVAETFGLPDSTFQRIRPQLTLSDSSVKKININTASVDELKAHPYIRYYIANAIVQYRAQHGKFSSLSELKKIMPVTDEVYNKVYKHGF